MRHLDCLESVMAQAGIFVRIHCKSEAETDDTTAWLLRNVAGFHLKLTDKVLEMTDKAPFSTRIDSGPPEFSAFCAQFRADNRQLAHLVRYKTDVDVCFSHAIADGGAVKRLLAGLGSQEFKVKTPVSMFEALKERLQTADVDGTAKRQERIVQDPVNAVVGRRNIEFCYPLKPSWKKRCTQKFYILNMVLKLKMLEKFNKNLYQLIEDNKMTFIQPFCVDFRRFVPHIDPDEIGNFFNTISVEIPICLDNKVQDVVQEISNEQIRVLDSSTAFANMQRQICNAQPQYSISQICGIEFSAVGVLNCKYVFDIIILYMEDYSIVPDCWVNCYTSNEEFRINITVGPKYYDDIDNITRWIYILYNNIDDDVSISTLIQLCHTIHGQ